MDTIHIPKVDPKNHGSLTGISMMSIDTDVESNVVLALNGLFQTGQNVLAALPFITHDGRKAWLIITQTPGGKDGR